MVMLETLIEQGVARGFFELSELGKLDKSCCLNSELEVIDFDKTKETVVAINKSLQQPKSTDALKIIPKLNRLDFIELKGFKIFIQRDKTKNFHKKIEDFDLEGKIIDSLFILDCIVKDNSIQFNKEATKKYRRTEKYYFLVVDIEPSKEPIKDRLINLIFLSLKKSLNDIENSSLHNLNKPKLLSCNQIDSYYQELLNKPSETL